jgi:hypothetical protein
VCASRLTLRHEKQHNGHNQSQSRLESHGEAPADGPAVVVHAVVQQTGQQLTDDEEGQRAGDEGAADLGGRRLGLPDGDVARDEAQADAGDDAADEKLGDGEAGALEDGAGADGQGPRVGQRAAAKVAPDGGGAQGAEEAAEFEEGGDDALEGGAEVESRLEVGGCEETSNDAIIVAWGRLASSLAQDARLNPPKKIGGRRSGSSYQRG